MRHAKAMLVFAALAALPWLAVLALGWEDEVGVITSGFLPSDGELLHGAVTVVARLLVAIVAPMLAIAGVTRLAVSSLGARRAS